MDVRNFAHSSGFRPICSPMKEAQGIVREISKFCRALGIFLLLSVIQCIAFGEWLWFRLLWRNGALLILSTVCAMHSAVCRYFVWSTRKCRLAQWKLHVLRLFRWTNLYKNENGIRLAGLLSVQASSMETPSSFRSMCCDGEYEGWHSHWDGLDFSRRLSFWRTYFSGTWHPENRWFPN